MLTSCTTRTYPHVLLEPLGGHDAVRAQFHHWQREVGKSTEDVCLRLHYMKMLIVLWSPITEPDSNLILPPLLRHDHVIVGEPH